MEKTKVKKFNGKGGNVFYFVMLALPVLQFVVFYIAVNVNSFLMAFQTYDNSTGTAVIGWTFDNFPYFFNGGVVSDILLCLKNSLLYFALMVFVCMPLSLLFSYYIYKKFRFSEFFKIILFLPSLVCISALVVFYRYFVNNALGSVTGGAIIGPIYHPQQGFVLIVFYMLLTLSANILLYINALASVPDAVVEAAEIDGASETRTFFYVLLPQIWGTVVSFLMIFLAGIATNQAYLFSFFGFNTNREYQTIGYYLFNMVQDKGVGGLEQMYRRAAALGLMLTVVLAPLTIGVRKAMLKFGPSEE